MDPEPNPWTLTTDFTKLIVTLAGALLGVTVTLAAQLIGKADFSTQLALYVTWSLAGLAMATGVMSHGLVVRLLMRKGTTTGPVLTANISYYSLVLAAGAFAVFGILALTKRAPVTAASVVESAASSLPALSADRTSTWKLQSLAFDSSTSTYDVVMIKDGSGETSAVTVNSTGEITRVRQSAQAAAAAAVPVAPTPVPTSAPQDIPTAPPPAIATSATCVLDSSLMALATLLGPAIGIPVECPHTDMSTGDTQQMTTTGLAYLRHTSHAPSFTNGWHHWAILNDAAIEWDGGGPDPSTPQ